MSSGKATSVCRASCNSSASRTSGRASSRTRAIAVWSRRPISFSTASGNMRRIWTARARLFQRCVVEEGIRVCVQNLVRKLRRDGSIDRNTANRSIANACQQLPQAVDVHGLGEDVLHYLLNEWVIGDPDVAFDVLLARRHIGKDRCQKIVAADALNVGRDFLAALETQQGQSAVGIPAPPRTKDWRRQRSLLKDFLHRLDLQIMENV